ncbi:hypothetical protein Fcan01_25860 [Folsomia candida]|uniref:Uncharacterized protein n=1 Tax=Folsomia candida TaxID=158441 RepID=A0A226D2N9_FOLCA|nr:hypothetical protein Fcan01_25860 [Folsomia candida]
MGVIGERVRTVHCGGQRNRDYGGPMTRMSFLILWSFYFNLKFRMANIHSKKGQLNSTTGKGIKKKTSQRDLSTLLTREASNVEDDEEEICSGLQDLVKRTGFETLPQIRVLFDNHFNYVGHKKASDKFVATCKTCIEIGTSKLYCFDLGNFKSNGNRHYRLSHKDIAVGVKPNHTVKEFFSSTQPGYSSTDPIQSRFNTNLDLVCVDGLPSSFINGVGDSQIYSIPNIMGMFPKFYFIITAQIGYLVTDGASNMVCGFRDWINETLQIGESVVEEFDLTNDIDSESSDQSECSDEEEDEISALGVIDDSDTDTEKNVNISLGEIFRFSCYAHGFQPEVNAADLTPPRRHTPIEFYAPPPPINLFPYPFTIEAPRRAAAPRRKIPKIGAAAAKLVGVDLCFQLVVKDVLAKGGRPKDVLDCANNIIKYFMRSSYWRKRLKKVLGKVLLKPAPTRWNYTFYILERLTQDNVYEEVCNLIHEASTGPRKPKNLPPTPSMEVKEKMVEIRDLLKLICDATNLLQEIATTSTKLSTCMKPQLLDGLKARFEGDLTDAVVLNQLHMVQEALPHLQLRWRETFWRHSEASSEFFLDLDLLVGQDDRA